MSDRTLGRQKVGKTFPKSAGCTLEEQKRPKVLPKAFEASLNCIVPFYFCAKSLRQAQWPVYTLSVKKWFVKTAWGAELAEATEGHLNEKGTRDPRIPIPINKWREIYTSWLPSSISCRHWCTKWTKRCRWYRKRASGVPTRTRHQFRASGRKLWQNSRCHSWFTSINLRCGIVVSDPNNYYSGWKNGGYTPGEASLIGAGCGKPLFSPDA